MAILLNLVKSCMYDKFDNFSTWKCQQVKTHYKTVLPKIPLALLNKPLARNGNLKKKCSYQYFFYSYIQNDSYIFFAVFSLH